MKKAMTAKYGGHRFFSSGFLDSPLLHHSDKME
jgi:hypothetical protein